MWIAVIIKMEIDVATSHAIRPQLKMLALYVKKKS